MQRNMFCNTLLHFTSISGIHCRLVRLSMISPVYLSIVPQITIINWECPEMCSSLRDQVVFSSVCMHVVTTTSSMLCAVSPCFTVSLFVVSRWWCEISITFFNKPFLNVAFKLTLNRQMPRLRHEIPWHLAWKGNPSSVNSARMYIIPNPDLLRQL